MAKDFKQINLDWSAKLFRYADKRIEALKLSWWSKFVPRYMKAMGAETAQDIIYYGKPVIYMVKNSRIVIGPNCTLCSDSHFTSMGVGHPVILKTLRPNADIKIGADTGLSGTTICACIKVEIGNNVLFGANTVVVDTDFHALKPHGRRYNINPEDIKASPVIISNNVFVGSGAYILKGVHIGENSIIGAGAIVTRDIPANTIAAGNPARVIKELKDIVD
ncbi:acyltransferase [Candidatus Desantisbacteria bacterium]|nr:acyltransferase [Candidatus Desantisbacteria bacterium]